MAESGRPLLRCPGADDAHPIRLAEGLIYAPARAESASECVLGLPFRQPHALTGFPRRRGALGLLLPFAYQLSAKE
ncbi:hypothetical protein GCM10027088_00890 [Nocardia goodfellowii]